MIDFSWIDSQFAFLLCLTLLHSIWQFSLLALLASMLDRLIKQRSVCLLYTSPSPRDRQKSRMPSSA